MDSASEYTEVLLRQIADMDQLVQQFGALRARIAELTENAAFDPGAQARLNRLEKAWDSGLRQQLEQMRAQIKTMVQDGVENLQRLGAGEQPGAMTSHPMRNKKVHKRLKYLC